MLVRPWLLMLLMLLALGGACVGTAGAQDGDADGPVAVASPAPTPDGCARGPETDADYAYCADPCRGADGEYLGDETYYVCAQEVPRGTEPRTPRRMALPVAAGNLPLTGGDPRLVALAGMGFLLTGLGLKLRFS